MCCLLVWVSFVYWFCPFNHTNTSWFYVVGFIYLGAVVFFVGINGQWNIECYYVEGSSVELGVFTYFFADLLLIVGVCCPCGWCIWVHLIVVFPFLVLVIDWIFCLFRPISYKILFSSALSCNVLRWANLDCLMFSIRNCLAFMPSLAAILGLACASGLISADAYDFVVWLGWVSSVGIVVVADVTIFLSLSSDILMCLVIFSLASSISIFMSVDSSVIWVSIASFTVVLICVSSISSRRNAMDLIVLIVCFGKPAITEIWCRQVARDVWVRGSPGGHNSECFSKNFLPSNGSLMSCRSYKMIEVPSCCEFGLGAFIGLSGILLSLVVCLSLLGGIW